MSVDGPDDLYGGLPVGPVPIATCTAGTHPTTKVQTDVYGDDQHVGTGCLLYADQPGSGATGYPVRLPQHHHHEFKRDGTLSPSSPTSPLYQTITCVDNGDEVRQYPGGRGGYYYKMRPADDCAGSTASGAVVPPVTTGSVLCSASDPMNNVNADRPTITNAAQHMTTFTLGLGVSGLHEIFADLQYRLHR